MFKRIFVIIFTLATLSFIRPNLAQNLPPCEIVLDTSLDVSARLSNGTSDTQSTSLPAGSVVKFVGQTTDDSYWILRYNGLHYHLSTASLSLPAACSVEIWGAPEPDYLPLNTVLERTGIATWHEAGYFGQGVRIGVIDTRYDDLSALLNSMALTDQTVTFVQPLAELETLMPEAQNTASHHGTNVVEVLATIAPQSHFVIGRAVDADGFVQVVNELIAANVDIIVHAGNVITAEPLPYHDAVRRATAADILWINAAGNIGAGYYPGRYSGDDLITNHQFDDPNQAGTQSGLMVPVERSQTVKVSLVWPQAVDEAGIALNDFGLIVYGSCNRKDAETFKAVSSDNEQVAGTGGYEGVILSRGQLEQIDDYTRVPDFGEKQVCGQASQPDGLRDNEIYVSIIDTVRTAQVDTPFDLYVEGALPSEFDPDISISLDPVVLVPGDIAESLTVGAFNPKTNTMAWYSGRMNSLQYYALNNNEVDYSSDELMKPDLVTYGELLLPSGREFFGTSAATPVVAGAAALLASAESNPPQALLRDKIASNVTCMSSDGVIGRVLGYLRLLSPDRRENATTLECGKYAWQTDLSSALVQNFVAPELVVAQDEASLQAKIANSNRLSSLAQNYIAETPDLAWLLGVEASHEYNSLDTWKTLFSALYPYAQLTGLWYDELDYAIWDAAISPDNRLLALGVGWQGVVKLYDLTTGQSQLLPLKSDDCMAGVHVIFDLQSSLLFYGGCSEIIVWDILSNKEVKQLEMQDVPIAFDSRNSKFATVNNNAIEIWNISTWQLIDTYVPNNPDVARVVFSPDDQFIASVSKTSNVELWDVANHEVVAELSVSYPAVAFSNDGSMLVTAGKENTREIIFWNISPLREGMKFDEPSKSISVRDTSILNFNLYGQELIVDTEAYIEIWDVNSGNFIERFPLKEEHVGFIEDKRIRSQDGRIQVSMDVSQLVGNTTDEIVKYKFYIWNFNNNQFFRTTVPLFKTQIELENLSIPRNETFLFTADSKSLISTTEHEIVFNNTSTGEVTKTINMQNLAPVLQIAISPDGTVIASGHEDNAIYLWNAEKGISIGDPLYAHDGGEAFQGWGYVNGVFGLAFSPDGNYLASSDFDEVIVWKLDQTTPSIHSRWNAEIMINGLGLGWDRDSHLIAYGSHGTAINYIDIETGTHFNIDTSHEPGTIAATWVNLVSNPNKNILATTTGCGPQFWVMGTQNQAAPDIQECGSVIGFDASGSLMVYAGGEYGIEYGIWDFEKQAELATGFGYHTTFSPDGNLLAYDDGSQIIILDISSERLEAVACHLVNRNMTEAEWATLMGGIPYRVTCSEEAQSATPALPIIDTNRNDPITPMPLSTPTFVLLATPTPVSLQCPDAYGPNFSIGDRFEVPYGDGPSGVFAEPNKNPKLESIAEGTGGVIIGGPVCVIGALEGNLIVWLVRTDSGIEGWASEGYPHSKVPWIVPKN